jgi:hypothetical protein
MRQPVIRRRYPGESWVHGEAQRLRATLYGFQLSLE